MTFVSAYLQFIVGVSIATGGLCVVAVMLVFAARRYLITAFGYSASIFIGIFCWPAAEMFLSQSLVITNGDLANIIDYPITSTWLFGW